VPEIHKYIGFAVVGGWFALMVWAAIAAIVRREPNRWYWRLLGVLQAILLLQIVVGLTLWISHPLPAFLHPFYGALFPAIVLVIAHVFARGLDDEKDRWKVFGWASLFVFGLTLRALMTGLGLA
jgi:hypothetical protein